MATLVQDTPSSGKRAIAKEANRRAILDAARLVFARTGYDACSIRDIIRETDLAAGTFYNYFKSKEEVFETLASDSVTRFRPLLRAVRAETQDLESYIIGAYRAYFHFLAAENEDAIVAGTPHLALVGVRVDTPEMKAISDEIRQDIETILAQDASGSPDLHYVTAAAIGIAREMGDQMLSRRPIDADFAARFASQLLLKGLKSLMTGSGKNRQA